MKVILFLISFFLLACSEVRLKKPFSIASLDYSKIDLKFCSHDSVRQKSALKFIFVMDRSGSNQNRYEVDTFKPLPPTDPTGERRFNALIRFVQSFSGDPLIYWSFINFNRTVLEAPSQFEFSNDISVFEEFVTRQRDETVNIDSRDTNYIQALTNVKDMIEEDIEKTKADREAPAVQYVIFFVSDGVPIVNSEMQDLNAIEQLAQEIKNFEEDELEVVESLQINTAYYSSPPDNPQAKDTLEKMAEMGEGDFLEFSEGDEINYNLFTVPVRFIKFAVKEVWVENLSTTWEVSENGKATLNVDSDEDGLSDVLEISLGSNPLDTDSDDNGLTDTVEYSLSGKQHPCDNGDGLFNCEPALPVASCASLQLQPPYEIDQWGNEIKYADSDLDHLNDCEEKRLGSDWLDHDTNDDYVPDRLALIRGVSLVGESNLDYLNSDYDDYSDYQEIKQNTPLHIANNQLEGITQLKLVGGVTSESNERTCYQYQGEGLNKLSNEDQIRVYILENSVSFKEKRVIRTVDKSLNQGFLNIEEEEFDFLQN